MAYLLGFVRPIKMGRHCSAWQMASSSCSLPQFLACVISNYSYLKGSLKYLFFFFPAITAFLFLVKWVFALLLRTSHHIFQNDMYCKAPPSTHCIVFSKTEYIHTQQPWRGPNTGKEVTEALLQNYSIMYNMGLTCDSCLRSLPVTLFDVPSKYRSLKFWLSDKVII